MLMYGIEGWVWQKKNECRINAVDMRSLRSMCGVSRKDRCRNSDVRERCGLKDDVVTRVGRGVLRRLGPLERANESRLTKQIIERMRVIQRSARAALENPMQTILVPY
ncbi:hypothetical protein EVAR_3592_1 [Eumeta japonica]|uniref:Uncharacterized protein n=1 Tax=Eumeta variegata TaxID=151549 RepID=A0A4C1SWE0_EUMVA|nr:hypothetical protein EVAR_3592_1 [Eumeta japonica]